jgi:hypothetical protein
MIKKKDRLIKRIKAQVNNKRKLTNKIKKFNQLAPKHI